MSARPYRLSDTARAALEAVLGPGVGEVRIVEHSRYAHWHRARATTRPGVIYLAMSGEEFERDASLMLHEFFHVLHQWQTGRMGRLGYLLELLRRGYWNNRFEVEARRFAGGHCHALSCRLADGVTVAGPPVGVSNDVRQAAAGVHGTHETRRAGGAEAGRGTVARSMIGLPNSVLRAIDRWLETGVIDAATAERLRAAEGAHKPAQTGKLAILAFGFGGLLLAAGVFLFVAANWQDLSPWSRFGILLAVVVALHLGAAFGAGFSRALATSLHAVGTAALGAGIFLSGQIFNLQAHWPEGFMLWAAGAAVAAWLLRDWPQVLWVAVLGPAWLVAEWASIFPWYRAISGEMVESVVPFGLVVLSAAYVSATTQDRDEPWRRALTRLGAVGLLITASGLASGGSEFMAGMEAEPAPVATLVVGWTVAVLLPFAVAVLLRGRQAWPVAIAAALALVVIALDASVTWQRLCIYLVYAAASAGLVGWGLRDRQRLRINLGVLSFALTVLAFYFSSLFDMLGRALGLIGMGLLCILGGWLVERGRRKLIARLEREGT